MSAPLEAYLARLYVDAAARRHFLADPRAAAMRAGLTEVEVTALERMDRVGLEMAASSFARKRASAPPRSRLARFLARWRRRIG